MPTLDVTSVLSDPDFATTISVTRNASATGENGRAVITPVTTNGIVAVVTPASSNQLVRLPDVENLSGIINIYTTFSLVALGAGIDADIVMWNGRQYTVRTVDDWSQFGSGFVSALAEMLPLH